MGGAVTPERALQSLDTAAGVLRIEQQKLKEMESALAVLETRGGQNTAQVNVCGIGFTLTAVSHESGWMPRLLAGMEEVHAAAIRLMRDRVAHQRARVEDCKWMVKQIAKDL